MARIRFGAQPVDRLQEHPVKVASLLLLCTLMHLADGLQNDGRVSSEHRVLSLYPPPEQTTRATPSIFEERRGNASRAYRRNSVADLVSLCSETCRNITSAVCSEIGDSTSTKSVILVVLAILNLTGISGGLLLYSYHSDCKFRLRNAGSV